MLKTTWSQLSRYVYGTLGHDKNNYYKSLYKYAYDFFKNRSFNEEGVAAFISHLETKRKENGDLLSHYTVNNYIKALKKLGHKEGFNLDDWHLKKTEPPHIPILEDDEIIVVVKRAYELDFRRGVVTELILRHGLRIGEVIHLSWKMFFGRSIYVTDTKTNKPREIPILPDLQDKIEKLRGNHHIYIFSTSKGNLDDATYNTFLRKILREIGIEKYTSAHKLRHSYATSSDGNGVSLRQIQETLGHKDIRTTQYYIHTTQKQLREAAKKSVLAKYEMTEKEMREAMKRCTMELDRGNWYYDFNENKKRIILTVYK